MPAVGQRRAAAPVLADLRHAPAASSRPGSRPITIREWPNPLWEKRKANWERILYEDLQYAPQIQESLQSRGFRAIPLNYQERRIYHWHEELDRRIGLNRVPPEARVEPVLHDFVEHS